MKLQALLDTKQVIDLDTLTADIELVQQIQVRLKDLGLLLASDIDGFWGRITNTALAEFCKVANLDSMQTGKFGPTFAKKLIEMRQLVVDKFLTEADYQNAAQRLGVNVATVKTVTKVESDGSGFLSSGRPKILFERHLFYDVTNGEFADGYPDICNYNPGGYKGGEVEWDRLNNAARLDRAAALRSTSWGLFQILGENFELCGFSSVEAYVMTVNRSEGEQLKAFVSFVINNDLVQYVRDRDWAQFARYYNGPDFAINQYDIKLAAAYEEFSSGIVTA